MLLLEAPLKIGCEHRPAGKRISRLPVRRHKDDPVNPAPVARTPARTFAVVLVQWLPPPAHPEPSRQQLRRPRHPPARWRDANLQHRALQPPAPGHRQPKIWEVYHLPEAPRQVTRLHPRRPACPPRRVQQSLCRVSHGRSGRQSHNPPALDSRPACHRTVHKAAGHPNQVGQPAAGAAMLGGGGAVGWQGSG